MTAKKKGARRESVASRKQRADVERIQALEEDVLRLSAELGKTERAYDAEVAFWKKEVEHLQQRVVNAVISAAVKK